MEEIYINVGMRQKTCFFMHTVASENFNIDISLKIIDFCGMYNAVIYEFNNDKWRVISISDQKVEYSIDNLEILLPELLKDYLDYFSCLKYDYTTNDFQELYCNIAPIKFIDIQEGKPKIEEIIYY